MRDYKSELADIQKGFAEQALRDMHPLRVYRPMPQQLAIHESKSSEVITIGGKRSGKTLSIVMEFGSRVLGIPITRPDGTKIPLRYRRPTPNKPSLFWVIGFDVNHIGQTLYHRLFSPGLGCDFTIITDKETGEWRAFNQNIDSGREDEAVLCPPMFQDSMLIPDSWHMESAAGNVFKSVRLKNGATLCAYPSTGDHAKQGDAVHGIWIDEDIQNGAFLSEWQDRLITTRGWLMWSVWPHVVNGALVECLERGEKEQDRSNPKIQVFRLVGSENLYSSKEGIEEGLARMSDDDDEAHRDRGDISALLGSFRMYEFGRKMHILRPEENKNPDSARQVLANEWAANGRFPPTWTRYLVIDPSHTRTACLFGVVPPYEWRHKYMGRRLVIEKELVVRKHTPQQFAEALLPMVSGMNFEAFVMDQQIGRQTTVGNDITVFESYSKQFAKYGIRSRATGTSFMRGCADKSLRRRTVREMLEPIEDGLPKLLVMDRCHQTITEFDQYKKKQDKDAMGRPIPLDIPTNERIFDCMACIEYLCQYVNERFNSDTAYIPPEYHKGTGSPAYHSAMAFLKEEETKFGGHYVHLGPGAAAQ